MLSLFFLAGRQLTPFQDEPHLRHWLPLVPQFLEEFFRHDAPNINPLRCASCAEDSSDETRLFRCVSCYEGFLFCGECIVRRHYANPFHRIEVSLRGCLPQPCN